VHSLHLGHPEFLSAPTARDGALFLNLEQNFLQALVELGLNGGRADAVVVPGRTDQRQPRKFRLRSLSSLLHCDRDRLFPDGRIGRFREIVGRVSVDGASKGSWRIGRASVYDNEKGLNDYLTIAAR